MRHGRVFFMGDAAKVVSPFGARGGNTGIADADNLAWKLAAVLKGRAAPALLDSYHEERHEAARQNVLVTNRTARFLRPADGVEKVFRDAALGLARQYVFARQLVNTGRMAVANPYTRSSACETTGGQSVQNVSFEWADGSEGTVNDLLRWADGRLLLLLFGDANAGSLQRLRGLGAKRAPLRCVQVLGAGRRGRRRGTCARPQGPSARRLPCVRPCLGADPARQLRGSHGRNASTRTWCTRWARRLGARRPEQEAA